MKSCRLHQPNLKKKIALQLKKVLEQPPCPECKKNGETGEKTSDLAESIPAHALRADSAADANAVPGESPHAKENVCNGKSGGDLAAGNQGIEVFGPESSEFNEALARVPENVLSLLNSQFGAVPSAFVRGILPISEDSERKAPNAPLGEINLQFDSDSDMQAIEGEDEEGTD